MAVSPNTGPLDLSQYISGVTDRAHQNWGRADDQYQWAKDQYAKDRGITDRVVNQALDTQQKTAGWADEDRAFWTGTYKPAMQQQMDYAREYTTPGRMAANRGAAMAGTNLAHDAAADMAKRNLSSYGVDPSSGRYAGLDAGLAAKRAASAAAAGTKSDRDTEMLGQEYLDRAIRTGASLPGQAANELGVSMAAGNQGVNAGLATTASGANTMGSPIQWAGMGNDMYKEWSRAAQAETDAGLKGQEIQMKRDEAKSKESSGIGAALGAGMGILGTAAGAYFGGPMGAKLGGSLGSSLGGSFGGSSSGGIFSTAVARGGLIKRMRAGGMVRGEPEPEDIENDDWERRSTIHRGYRPGRETVPGSNDEPENEPRAWREPLDTSQWDPETPQTDTYDEYPTEEEYHSGAPLPEKQPWVPNYDEGGRVREAARTIWGEQIVPPVQQTMPAYAEGGEVEDDEFVDTPEDEGAPLPEEMPMEEGPPPQEANVVPPEASPSGGEETDDVHALLNEGEFVIPKKVTNWYGEKYFQKLIEKAYTEMSGPKTAEPEAGPPTQAVALSPPSFQSAGG